MTELQLKCLNFIRDFIDRHEYSPSLDEIATGIGQKNKSSIYRLVIALESQGKVTRTPHRDRTIQIVPESGPVACIPCEDTLMEGDIKSLAGMPVCVAARPCSHCNGGVKTARKRAALQAAIREAA